MTNNDGQAKAIVKVVPGSIRQTETFLNIMAFALQLQRRRMARPRAEQQRRSTCGLGSVRVVGGGPGCGRHVVMLAVWHHPLFSSSINGKSSRMRDAWRLLQQWGAEVVVTGHDHAYERYAPQDADGRASAAGMREFVVGTGGYSLYDVARRQPNSGVLDNRTWGVIKFTLRRSSCEWEFVPIDGQTFRDYGSGTCSVLSAR